tara:strand:+ start:7607 stop:8434 length:828 start_codon:yes stop_codon:yes gene_type:complete
MKYQFQSNQGQFSYNPSLFTDAIKLLVSINFIIFILQSISSSENLFFPLFGLVPKLVWSELMLWQPLTYMFLHGGVWHVLINMFVLWMFGSELERLWGKNRFIKFYFFTGIGAGIVTMLFSYNSNIPIVGASGAVYGILLAYGFIYPNRKVYLYGIIPIKSIWFVIAVGLLAFISSINNNSNISHLTHLSGMGVAYFILKNPFHFKSIWFSIQKKFIENTLKKERNERSRRKKIEIDLNFILDKINREGYDSLTNKEQDQLYKSSKALSLNKKKD